MVIKKAIGIIVCSVLMGGNCMASGSEGDESAEKPAMDSANRIAPRRKKLAQPRQHWIALQRKELRKLSEQIAVVHAILQAQTGQNRNEEAEERQITPFVSVKALRRYIKRIEDGEASADDLSERINSTVDYFLHGKGQEISGPVAVAGDWPRSKCVEILHIIKRRFPEYDAISQRKIHEIVGERVVINYAQLLLMSQCAAWNEGNNDYELDSCANESIVKAAIDMLRSVVTLGVMSFSENDIAYAKNFLDAIKGLNGFKEYCYSISSD
jgi:hypothetical protein